MADSIVSWVPVIGSVMATVAAIFTTYKVVIEARSLLRRNVKELLDLMQEAGNRFEKESAKAVCNRTRILIRSRTKVCDFWKFTER
jgi:hypothetical protein